MNITNRRARVAVTLSLVLDTRLKNQQLLNIGYSKKCMHTLNNYYFQWVKSKKKRNIELSEQCMNTFLRGTM